MKTVKDFTCQDKITPDVSDEDLRDFIINLAIANGTCERTFRPILEDLIEIDGSQVKIESSFANPNATVGLYAILYMVDLWTQRNDSTAIYTRPSHDSSWFCIHIENRRLFIEIFS